MTAQQRNSAFQAPPTPQAAGLRLRVIAAAVMAACATGAGANPSGATVVSGSASFAQDGSTLTVSNSPGAILNWQSFSIANGETTRFNQQSAASAVLNRVVGQDPSAILGTLSSNGRVFLINPNGVLFGANAVIDVAGLVASTLNISDPDFLADRLHFSGGGAAGIRNEGRITSTGGGSVFLVGGHVDNTGSIDAAGGSVTLAAGDSVTLAGGSVRLGDTANPNVLVELAADSERVSNLGTVSAAGGAINIYAGIIDQRGIVRANGVSVDASGRIHFVAQQDVTLAAGSSTSASGPQGGGVAIDSRAGTLIVEGDIAATGSSGRGGAITLTGEQVGIAGAAIVDASGEAGGSIRVGGDYRGENPDVHNARAIYVGADTRLAADAATQGDGGRIILWSDEATRAYGAISARGGALGGDGGFVETSAKGFLDVTRAPDVSAVQGSNGEWLLDPGDLTVIETPPGNLDTAGPTVFTATGAGSTISNDVINAALDAGTAITLDTGLNAIGGSGNLTVLAPIVKTTGATTSLTLNADNRLLVLTSIRDDSGAGLDVNLNSGRSNSTGDIFVQGDGVRGIATGPGSLSLNPGITARAVLANELYTIGGTLNATGTLELSTNAVLRLGTGAHTVNNLFLDPNVGGGLTLATDSAGTLRALAIGGTLTIADPDTTGAGVVNINEVALQGIATPISVTSIATHNVNLTGSTLDTSDFSMTSGSLASTGRLFVSQSFTHSGGTINFGTTDPATFIDISHSGASLVLSQPLTAFNVFVSTPLGSLVDGNGTATDINAINVSLSSCLSCSATPGSIGSLLDPLEIQGATTLSASLAGLTPGGIYLDHRSGGSPVQLDGISNGTLGGVVSLSSDGDIALVDFCPDGCAANVRTQGGNVTLQSTLGSIGSDIPGSQGLIDTTPFPSATGSLPGGSVTLTAATDVKLFSISTAASSPGADGPGAIGGNVSITASGGVDVININARGGNGTAAGTALTTEGGNGGSILINAGTFAGAAGDVVPLTDPQFFSGTVGLSGGFITSGGNGGTDQLGITGFAGGDAGSISINITNLLPGPEAGGFIGRIEARGGNGGSGLLSGSSGGNGGAGGSFALTAPGGAGAIESLAVWDGNFATPGFLAPSIITAGGNGGGGEVASGSGGNAGSVLFSATAGSIGYGWNTVMNGGNAGVATIGTQGNGGSGGSLAVTSAGPLVIGSALAEVSGVTIDARGGVGATSGTNGVVSLTGTSGISQLDPLTFTNPLTVLTLNATAGDVNLALANSLASVSGGSSGNWLLRSSEALTVGGVTVGGNAEFVVDTGVPSVQKPITFNAALAAGGNVTIRADEPAFGPAGTVTSGAGATNFIAFLPNVGASVVIDDTSISDLTRFFTPTFRLGDNTTTNNIDFANTVAGAWPNIGALSVTTSGTITQSATGGMQVAAGAGGMQLSGSSVNVGASSNSFATLAGAASSSFSVGAGGSFALGTVDGLTGITAPTQVRLESFNGDVDVTATGLSSASVLYHTPGAGIARLGGTLGGNQTVFHDMDWSGGTLSSGSFLATQPGVSAAMSGPITLNGTFTNRGPLTVSGAITASGGALNNVAGATIDFNGATMSGFLINNSGVVNASGTNALAVFNATGGSVFNIVSGTATAGNMTNNGTIEIATGATGSFATLSNNAVLLANGGTATATTINNTGSVEVTAGGSVSATNFAANTGSVIVSTATGGSVVVSSNFQQLGSNLISGTFANLQLSSLGALSFTTGLTATGNLLLNAAGTLSLGGVSATSYNGSNVDLSGTGVVVDSATVNAANDLSVTAGSLSVTGTTAFAKLLATNTVTITATDVSVSGGSFGASIDPVLLDINLSGDLTLTGGSVAGASAELLADSIVINATNVTITGGGGDGASASIVATGSLLSVDASTGVLALSSGSGLDSDATLLAPIGTVSVSYGSCTGCTVLALDPIATTTNDSGFFAPIVLENGVTSGGTPPTALPTEPLIEVDPSIVFAAAVAESGGTGTVDEYGTGDDLLTAESDEVATGEDDDDAVQDESGNQENGNEQSPGKGLPVCT